MKHIYCGVRGKRRFTRAFFVLSLLASSAWTSAYSQVNVVATSGTTSGSYGTLNAAFASINDGTHKGAITINIVGNTTEPAAPVPLLKSGGNSDYSSVLIRPQGGNFVINSAATPTANRGVIELAGADNVTIDGDDPATSGDKNLSIIAAAGTPVGVACVRISSNSTTGADGADNITVKNCIITGSRPSSTNTDNSYGIQFSNGVSTSSATSGAYANMNTLIENNLITRAYIGINAIGSSTTYLNPGLIIRNNVLGTGTAATNIGQRGIVVSYTAVTAGGESAQITGNEIMGGGVSYSASVGGIEVKTSNAGLAITKNNIHDIIQPSTSGYGAWGIYISSSSSNADLLIANNFIRDIVACKYTTSVTNQYTNYGIYLSETPSNINIIHNTIALNALNTTGTTTDYLSACINFTASTSITGKILNNIFINKNGQASTRGYCLVSSGTFNATAVVDNNNYYTPGSGRIAYYNSSDRTTLTALKTATGKDGASLSVDVPFASATDLHIPDGTMSFLESAGAAVSVTGIASDIDGAVRPGPSTFGYGTAPDIGADEFDGNIVYSCVQPVPGNTLTTNAIICNGTSVTLSVENITNETGIRYQWQISTDNVTYTDATGATNPSYITTPSGSLWYRLKVTCMNGPVDGYSTPVQVAFETELTSTTPATRCGIGMATISATAPAGQSVQWYSVATGGVPVFTGDSYTTPVLNATTTYYASTNKTTPGGVRMGNGTSSASATGLPNPLSTHYGGSRTQMLFKADELITAGLSAGNITTLSFDVTGILAAGIMNDLKIKMGTTSGTSLSTMVSGLGVVYNVPTLSLTATGLYTFTLDTPFNWDGASNIVVEVIHNAGNSGSGSGNTVAYTGTSFTSVLTQRKDNVTPATSDGFEANSDASISTSSSRPNIVFGGLIACWGPRVPVQVTINPAPAFAITADKTICNDAVQELTVVTGAADFDEVKWSPVADLYTDAAATVAYTAGTHASSVYVKSATVGAHTYTASARNTTTDCGNTAQVAISVLPGALSAAANPGELCNSGDASLSATPAITATGISYQWLSSNDNATYTPVAGATSATLALTGLTATAYYKLEVYNSDNQLCLTSVQDTIRVNAPALTSSNGATRCGTGTVDLTATGVAGSDINWYADAAGTQLLGTGNTFTTPVVSATTSYWVESSFGSSVNVGPSSPIAQGGTLSNQTVAWTVRFTTHEATRLVSIDVFPLTAGVTGNLQVYTGNTTSGTLLTTIPYTTTVSGGETAQTIVINLDLPAGNYNINPSLPSGGLKRNTSNASYPYSSSIASITGNEYDPIYYMGFYNWVFGKKCASTKVEVVATVTPPPAFAITADKTICNDAVQELTVVTGVTDFDEVTWSPVANLYTDAAATIAYTANSHATTVYYKNNAAGNAAIIASANNTTSGCANVDTVQLNILPASAATKILEKNVCFSGDIDASIAPAITTPGVAYQWQISLDNVTYVDAAGETAATITYTGVNTTTYFRAKIYNSDNQLCFTTVQDTAIVSNPELTAVNGAERCGPGTVDLTATVTGNNTVKWYSSQTSSAVLGTGTTFTTPSISATTSFWAEAAVQGSESHVGPLDRIGSLAYYMSTGWGITFDASEATVIRSVAVYPSSAGTMTLVVKSGVASGATVFGTYTATFTAAQVGTKVILPININVPAGTGYKMLVQSTTGGVNLHRDSGVSGVFPSSTPGNPITITSSEWGGTTTGTYYFFYDWVIGSSCASPRQEVIAVVKPAPTVTIASAAPGVCDGNAVAITGTVVDAVSVQWYRNDQVISGQTNNNYSATTAGTYKLIATGVNGCTTTSNEITLTAGATPVVNLGNDTLICVNRPLVLNAENTGATYTWSTGESTPSITVSTAGTYSVTVSANNCTATDQIVVTIQNVPSVQGIQMETLYNEQPGKVRFTAVNAANGTSYLWNFGDNTTSTDISPVHVYAAPGYYQVTLTVSNRCDEVTVNQSYMIDFTPVGTEKIETSFGVGVYPNPATDKLTVEVLTENTTINNVKVFNTMGQLIMDIEKINTGKTIIPVKELPAGIYTFKVETDKGTVIRKVQID